MEHPALDSLGAFTGREAYAWMFDEAAWKQRKVNVSGHTVVLERGQMAYSGRFMAKAWDWPEPTVRQFLGRLQTDGLITCTNTYARRKIITLCEYNQIASADDELDAATSHGPRTDVANEKERKNGKVEEFRKATPSGPRARSEHADPALEYDAERIAEITGLDLDHAMDLPGRMHQAAQHDECHVSRVIGATVKAHSRGDLRNAQRYLLAAAARRGAGDRDRLEANRRPVRPFDDPPSPTRQSGAWGRRPAQPAEFDPAEDE